MNVRVQFEPRDLWVGVYVKPLGRSASRPFFTEAGAMIWVHRIYVCIVPMFPIVLEWVA